MNIFNKQIKIAFTFLLFWLFIMAVSLLFYDVFLANGELGLIELLTNAMYILLLYYVAQWGRKCNISSYLIYALALLGISLLDRELNFQRRTAILFVDISYYRSHIQLWTHMILYLPFLYCVVMAIKKYCFLIEKLVWECVFVIGLLMVAVVISQIADKAGAGDMCLALEETLELMIPILLINIVYKIFTRIKKHQSLGVDSQQI